MKFYKMTSLLCLVFGITFNLQYTLATPPETFTPTLSKFGEDLFDQCLCPAETVGRCLANRYRKAGSRQNRATTLGERLRTKLSAFAARRSIQGFELRF